MQKAHEANIQNTGAMNLSAIQRDAPEAAQFLAMHYKPAEYADPFNNQDPHAPRRSFNDESPM